MFKKDVEPLRLQIKVNDELNKLSDNVQEESKLTNEIITRYLSKMKAVVKIFQMTSLSKERTMSADTEANDKDKQVEDIISRCDISITNNRDNLLSLIEDCKLLYESRDSESFYLYLQGQVRDALFLFIIGSYKTGKSFLTKNLMNKNGLHPTTGPHEVANTTGELIYEFSSEKYIVDTEGLNQLVSNMRTEFIKLFLLEHACKLGRIVIYVIDKFTVSEFKEIVNLMNMIRRNIGIELIVVHNMRTIGDVRNLMLYKRQVKQAMSMFNPQDRDDNFQIIFHNYTIFNLFLGNESTLTTNNKKVFNFLHDKLRLLGGQDESFNKSVQWVADQIEQSQGLIPRARSETVEVVESKNIIKFESGRSSIIRIKREMFNPYLPRSDWFYVKDIKESINVIKISFNLPFYRRSTLRISLSEDMKFQITYTQIDPMNKSIERIVSEIIYIPERIIFTKNSEKWTNETTMESNENNVVLVYLQLQGI